MFGADFLKQSRKIDLALLVTYTTLSHFSYPNTSAEPYNSVGVTILSDINWKA